MARIRTIKPKFWDDVKVAKLPRDARLLYIGMWNFADDLGVIIADHIWLKSKIFPFDQIQIQQFDKWIEMIVKLGFISLFSYNGEEFYYLPKLTLHQVINRPNLEDVNVPKSALESIVGMVFSESPPNHGSISDQSVIDHAQERKGIGKNNNSPIVLSCDNSIVSEENADCAIQSRAAGKNKSLSITDDIADNEGKYSGLKQQFEIFRKAYRGTKRGLNVEFEAFRKKHKDWQAVIPLLTPALERLIRWRNQCIDNHVFCPEWPYLSTWLNQRRWEEELPDPRKTNVGTGGCLSKQFPR